MNKIVSIVEISTKTNLYKDGVVAERIEMVNCKEHGFNLIAQKDLYQVGDRAVYIQPDYCLSEHDLFKSFTEPNGDPKKSRLGKQNRIRAIKFNFTVDLESTDPVYSVGILLPFDEVKNTLNLSDVDMLSNDLAELLGVYKYEEPDTMHSGMAKGDLPAGMYSTDETNIENVLEKLAFPVVLIGTVKVDASSITIYHKDNENEGICSRNLEKKLEQTQVVGYVSQSGDKLRRHYNRETSTKGWFNENTNEFFDTVPEGYTEVIEAVRDSFIENGLPVLVKLREYCNKNNRLLALRGELYGEGLKGSGNKNNPHSKLKQGIAFYGLDDYASGYTRKLPSSELFNLCNELGLQHVDVIFNKEFASLDELRSECLSYFKDNLVEGIVIKTVDSRFSAKYMNLEYDSKK